MQCTAYGFVIVDARTRGSSMVVRSILVGGTLVLAAMAGRAAAADVNSQCITISEAALAGPAAAEAAAYQLGMSLLGADAALIQDGCNALWCVPPGTGEEVIEAIRRGVLRSGNEDLAACVADDPVPRRPAPDVSPN
jgi:hypothetical protein